jgi:hypothetical protein
MQIDYIVGDDAFEKDRLGSSSRNFSDQTRAGNTWPENVEQIVRAGQAAAQ